MQNVAAACKIKRFNARRTGNVTCQYFLAKRTIQRNRIISRHIINDHITRGKAHQVKVIAGAPHEQVVAVTLPDRVIPGATIDGVIAFRALKLIVTAGAQDAVMHGTATSILKIQDGIDRTAVISRAARRQVNRHAGKKSSVARFIIGISHCAWAGAKAIRHHVGPARCIRVIRTRAQHNGIKPAIANNGIV